MTYESDVNIYTEEGRIKQVEYAMKAMNLGTTTIAAKIDGKVVLVSEKKFGNKLQKPNSVKKHFKIYDNVVSSFAGISSDAPEIIRRCRSFCCEHESMFDTNIPAKLLLDKICSLALKFGESKDFNKIYSRPFGVNMLFGIYDTEPRLFCIDPSGSYVEYKARVIGSACEIVEQQLETATDLSVKKMLEMLKGVMEEKISENNIEVTFLGKEGIEKQNTDQLRELLHGII